MSGFSESTFVEKLGNLQNTQQSIQTISGWVLYHKKRFKQTVAVWEQEVNKAPTAKKLTLFYLANDIIQNAKRKKITEFLDEFSKTIRRTLPHIYRSCEDKTRIAIDRVLDVWEERHVYSGSFIVELRKSLSQIKRHKITDLSSVQHGDNDGAPIKKTPLTEALASVEALQVKNALSLEQSVSDDILSGDLIRRVKANQDQWPSAMEKVGADSKWMKQMTGHLEEEVRQRSRVIDLLNEAVAEQTQRLRETRSTLESLAKTAQVVTGVEDELKTLFEEALEKQTPAPPQNSADNQQLDMELSNSPDRIDDSISLPKRPSTPPDFLAHYAPLPTEPAPYVAQPAYYGAPPPPYVYPPNVVHQPLPLQQQQQQMPGVGHPSAYEPRVHPYARHTNDPRKRMQYR